MICRVAMSELFRDSPTAIRTRWAFRDYIGAHVILDVADRDRARREAEHGRP